MRRIHKTPEQKLLSKEYRDKIKTTLLFFLEEGEKTESVLCNRVRQLSGDSLKPLLAELENDGKIARIVRKHGQSNRKLIVSWILV